MKKIAIILSIVIGMLLFILCIPVVWIIFIKKSSDVENETENAPEIQFDPSERVRNIRYKAYENVSRLLDKIRKNEEITQSDFSKFKSIKDRNKVLTEDFLLDIETTLGKKLGFRKVKDNIDWTPVLCKYGLFEKFEKTASLASGRYFSPDKYKMLKKYLKKIIKENDEYFKLVNSDEYEFAVYQAEGNVRSFSGLKGKKFDTVKCRPFVLFVERDSSEKNSQEDNKFINITKDLIKQHSALFKKEIVKKYNLKYDPKKALIVICFKSKSSYVDYCRKNEVIPAEDIISFYHKQTQCVYIYKEKGLMLDLKKLKFYLYVIACGITHQQFDYYINSIHKDRLNWKTRKNPHSWLLEGFSEYFGQIDFKENEAKYIFEFWKIPEVKRCVQLCNALYPGKYSIGKQLLKLTGGVKVKHYNFTVKEMIMYGRNYHTAMNYFLRKLRKEQTGVYNALARKGALRQIAVLGKDLLYCQGLTFIHFCFKYKKGKYEPAIRKYLGYQCTDQHDVSLFPQCFNVKTDADWKRLNDEYIKYTWNEVIVKNGYDKIK